MALISDCSFDVYKKYVGQVEEVCVGPTSKVKESKKGRGGVLGRILSDRDLPGRRSVNQSPTASGKEMIK